MILDSRFPNLLRFRKFSYTLKILLNSVFPFQNKTFCKFSVYCLNFPFSKFFWKFRKHSHFIEFPFYRESNCNNFSFPFSKFIRVQKKNVYPQNFTKFRFPLAKQDILKFSSVLSELPIFKKLLEIHETFPFYRIPILSRIKLQAFLGSDSHFIEFPFYRECPVGK